MALMAWRNSPVWNRHCAGAWGCSADFWGDGEPITFMSMRSAIPARSRRWVLAARLCALALLIVALPACSWFQKEEIIPDDPADKLYNEGLYLLNNKRDYKLAAKRFKR